MKLRLIGSCTLAVSLLAFGAATAQTPPAGYAKVRAACKADMDKYCAVEAGGSDPKAKHQCMKSHKADLSAPCQSALTQAKAERKARKAAEAGAVPATPAPH